jgi:ParB-like nuclease domain
MNILPAEPLQVQAQTTESAPLRQSGGVETRKISEIKKSERHRKAMGDIDGLVASIETIGLLHPVVINKDNELIAGARRIVAFKLLRREEIPVTVVDIDSAEIVLGEHAENEQRKGFTNSERVAIGKEVERVIGNRKGRRTDLQPVQAACTSSALEVKAGQKTQTIAAAKAGFGNPETYRQAKAVVTAAEAEPEKFGALAEEMDASGKVEPAYKQPKASKRSAGSKSRRQSRRHQSRARQPDAQMALAEFKYAVNHQFPQMDDDTRLAAVKYVIENMRLPKTHIVDVADQILALPEMLGADSETDSDGNHA